MTLAPARSGEGGVHAATETPADGVIAKLQDPQVAGSLAVLLDHADLLAMLVESLDGFIARSEVIGDSFVAGLTEIRGTHTDGELTVDGLDLKAVGDAGRRLLNSGMLSADTVDELAVVSRGLVKGRQQFGTDPVQIGGALSLLRLLKDPDVNRGLAYVATVLRAVGRELDAPGAAESGTIPQSHQ